MQNQKSTPFGVFPAPTLSQIENLLDERQKPDRRQSPNIAVPHDRRKKQRRDTSK